MTKNCKSCGIEIADTDYDSQGRYNAVQYCPECRQKRDAKHICEAKARYRKRKALNKSIREWYSWATTEDEFERYESKKKELWEQKRKVNLLKEENRLLRKSNAQLRAEMEGEDHV